MSSLTLHELTASPNSVKVRIALGYKGLEYERKPLELDEYPGDRTPVIALSRQPRLPVLQDGKTVIFDSGAILRYLEANYPETPPLFSEDHAALREIEEWELFARARIGEAIGMVFAQAFAGSSPDPEVLSKADEMLHERLGAIEDRLSTSDFLVGDHLTAADIVCAAPLYLADLSEEGAKSHPILELFHATLKLRKDRGKTRSWIRKALAYDPVFGKR